MLASFLNNKRWDSKCKQEITNKEKFLGYFIGPSGMLLLNAVISNYLNTFYTDVLGLLQKSAIFAVFMVVMPLVSEIIDVLTNLFFGKLIDNTRNRQGKARPWLIISAPLITLSGILVFVVPTSNEIVQMIWIAFSYNLYYSLAYTIYNLSHSMMMPLSTHESKKRDVLAIFTNLAQCIIPGMFVSMMFPLFILNFMGHDPSRWLLVSTIFSIIAFPCIFIEYYFTKERVSEANGTTDIAHRNDVIDEKERKSSIVRQFKAAFKSKYWTLVMIMQAFAVIINAIVLAARLYYARWVLADVYSGGDWIYTILNVVGMAPLGFGVFAVAPLIKKFGKRNCILCGAIIVLLGDLITLFFPTNLMLVLTGLIISSIGSLPSTYAATALLADTMDHVEFKTKIRVDGITMATYTTFVTISDGVAKGILNWVLSITNYIAPTADTIANLYGGNIDNIVQPDSMKIGIIVLALGVNLIAPIINLLCMVFYKLDKQLPEIENELKNRREANQVTEVAEEK